MLVPSAPRAVAPTVATPTPTSMLVVATTSDTVVCGARGLRCLAPHPLPDCLSLLSSVINLPSELPDLLL